MEALQIDHARGHKGKGSVHTKDFYYPIMER